MAEDLRHLPYFSILRFLSNFILLATVLVKHTSSWLIINRYFVLLTNSNNNHMKNTSILSVMLFTLNRWDFCFQVNKYLENYERALRGFEAAALKDPGLNAGEEVQKMVNLLDKLENMLRVIHLFVNVAIC